jgi:hypothetical protein
MITLQDCIKNGWAIHCSIKTEAVKLFEELDRLGIIWASGEKLTENNTRWNCSREHGMTYLLDRNHRLLFSTCGSYERTVEFTDLLAPYGFNLHLCDIGTVKVQAPKLTIYGSISAIYSNGNTTVVLFDDGKKVKVKRAKDDSGSIYSAVAYALAEHIYGSNTAFKKVVDKKLHTMEVKQQKHTSKTKQD